MQDTVWGRGWVVSLIGSVLVVLVLAASPAHVSAAAEGTTAKVINVLDGDTLEVDIAGTVERVHLHGIDCPEIGDPFGDYAKRLTTRLTSGKDVSLEIKGVTETGEKIADVRCLSGNTLSILLLRAGWARCDRSGQADAELANVEKTARFARKGMWRTSSSADADLARRGIGISDGPTGDRIGFSEGASPPSQSGEGLVSCDATGVFAVQLRGPSGSVGLDQNSLRKTVPAGQYQMTECRFELPDGAGSAWRIAGWSRNSIVVHSGGTTVLTLGPPFMAKLSLRNAKGACSFTLSTTGRGGENYTSIQRDGKHLDPPGIEIRDAKDQVVHVGKFQYG